MSNGAVDLREAEQARTPAIWEKTFLKAMSLTGNVSVACKKAKINRSTVYRHGDSDPVFKALWDEARAEAADWLEAEAYRRAVKGVKRPVYQQKELVGYVTEYSDSLLIRLLEANNPQKFRRNIDVTSDGKPLPITVVKMDLDEL